MNLPRLALPHIKLKKLTKVLVITGAALAVLFLTAAVVREYRANQQKLKQQHQAELQAAEQRGYKRGTKEITGLRNVYILQSAECKKGQNAYNALTIAQKRLIKADQIPKCRTEVL